MPDKMTIVSPNGMTYTTHFLDEEATWVQPLETPTLMEEVLGSLHRLFPMLYEISVCPGCPKDVDYRPYRDRLSFVIVHLNDIHRWTREEISDWLETLDLDLEAHA